MKNIDSSDEALCEILGLTSLEGVAMDETDEDPSPTESSQKWAMPQCPNITHNIAAEIQRVYKSDSVCILPRTFSIPDETMRHLTDELVWGRDIKVDKTYETIRVLKKNGEIEERRTLTRLENFVNHHERWRDMCLGYICSVVSAVVGTEMVLYKEKLNLKPPGGSGFAPHLDTPSLRVALGDSGPQTFVTAMVAIDNMTSQNGCLRIAKGPWSEDNNCELVPPEQDGNPDAGGRAGAIPVDAAESFAFEDITCLGGDIVTFNGWAPHRSSANSSPFPRRAVFLTYHPASEGDFHNRYYERMDELRNEWRTRVGLSGHCQLTADEQNELNALATVPK
jgi:ectoine hydroxylase-related dioxygenase (phytanoyl-CoA dioxygenase family)